MAGKTYEDFIASSKFLKKLLKFTECCSFKIFNSGTRYEYIFRFSDESSNCYVKCKTKIILVKY